MRRKKPKFNHNCPFCGKMVDKTSEDCSSMVRENKYLDRKIQYFHKSCYQKFYSGEKITYDRTTTSTKPIGAVD